MFKKILFINFIVSIVLGNGIYIAQNCKIKLPAFINNYLNDFLIIPITLTICLYVLRITRNDKIYKITFLMIVYLCLFFSVFFEKIMPQISERYTADIFDVFIYFLGGIWFWILQRKNVDL